MKPSLLFEMQLPDNPQDGIVRGYLTAFEDENIVLRAYATSGARGFQSKSQGFWARGKSPLPPGQYDVDTTVITANEGHKLAMGSHYFHIEPDPVVNPENTDQQRSELCLHLDGPFDPYESDVNVGLGTAGCVGVRDFNDFYLWIRGLGVDKVSLVVEYF